MAIHFEYDGQAALTKRQLYLAYGYKFPKPYIDEIIYQQFKDKNTFEINVQLGQPYIIFKLYFKHRVDWPHIVCYNLERA